MNVELYPILCVATWYIGACIGYKLGNKIFKSFKKRSKKRKIEN